VLAGQGIVLDMERHRVTRDGAEIPLTLAQFDVLRVLMSEPGRVFSRKELLESTSGYVYEGYERTMDVHVKNIRKVLEIHPDQPERVVTVRGVGYKFKE
jgi:DNA-binding response OmpR family regulator